MAAGEITQTSSHRKDTLQRDSKCLVNKYAFEANGAGAIATLSVPVAQQSSVVGFLVGVQYAPDSVTPPDSLDIEIKNSDGVDLLGGNGANRTSNSVIEPSTSLPFVDGYMDIVLSGNTTANAKGAFVITLV